MTSHDYKHALYSQSAVNVIALARWLGDKADAIGAEVEHPAGAIKWWLGIIVKAGRQAWHNGGSGAVNQDQDVQRAVLHLWHYAFDEDELDPVACHPIARLIITQLGWLTVGETPPLEAWESAMATAEEKANG